MKCTLCQNKTCVLLSPHLLCPHPWSDESDLHPPRTKDVNRKWLPLPYFLFDSYGSSNHIKNIRLIYIYIYIYIIFAPCNALWMRRSVGSASRREPGSHSHFKHCPLFEGPHSHFPLFASQVPISISSTAICSRARFPFPFQALPFARGELLPFALHNLLFKR